MSPVTRPGNISDVINNRLGTSAKCPKCGNVKEFTAYMTTDIISINISADKRVDRPWMIMEPNLGQMKIKEIRCSRCNYRNSPQHFRSKTDEEIRT